MNKSACAAEQQAVRRTLADNVLRLRNAHAWTQEELAFQCGLHRTFVAHVEREVRNISIDNIVKLAHALGVPAYQLLTPAAA